MVSAVVGNHDLMEQVFEHLKHEPLQERRVLGSACILVNRRFFILGTKLIWSDLSDYSDLKPLFQLLDDIVFSQGLVEKVFSWSSKD